MKPPLGSLMLYTKCLPEMVVFYSLHFGYTASQGQGDRLVELMPPPGGLTLLLHPAAKSQKMGQVLVKLNFDVEDVAAFCANAQKNGLVFGARHQGDGYVFANAKDPSGNPICVTGRAFGLR